MTRTETSKDATSLSQVDVAFLRAARAGNIEKVLNFLNEDGDINTSNANGLNAMHLASKEGHVDVMRELLRRGAPVNGTTKKGNTALHIASLAGQREAVDLLLESGASVNSKAQNGFTPLYMASQEGHFEVVKILLTNGANQQSTTEDGFTAIDVAVQQGHDKVVSALLHSDSRKGYRSLHTAARKDFAKAAKLLLQKGHQPDVEAPNGFTPLHLACKYGNFNVGSVLIQFGATVDYKTKNYIITPLHVASKYGHLKMVTLLSDKGSKIDLPNKDGLTPLHCAARDGQDAVVDYLIQKNSSIVARTKHGLTPLHMACQGNNVKTATVLLDNKAPVNAVAANGLTPLHISAHYGHANIAELLLDRGADTDARARNGFTALHIACKKNREPVIQLLLKYGANVHSANEGGQTPMHVATYYGNVTLVLLLLQHGGSPDITNVRGETALHIACRRKEITIVRLLLRNGAAVDAKTQDRETPLHIATRTRNTELVHLLLDHGASPDCIDKNKCTPLHLAAREGDEEIVNALVEHGASVTALSKKGFTPLHEAARSGHVQIVILLIKHYENPDPEGKHGLTPLHVAAHYDHANVALYLLENGASAYAATKNGFTPLHIAAQRNQTDIGVAMLDHGVEPDIRTQTGISPLHLAAKEGNIEMCEMLLEHGAMPGITTNNGLTPLHLCARWNRVEVAKLLLRHKTPMDAQTVSGFTPLHIACVYGHFDIAKLLLEEGGDVEAKTKNGYMPLHLAAQHGHKLLIEILLIHNAPPNALTNEGYSALFIAQTVMKSTTIIEILLQITKVTEPPTVIKPGQPEIEGVATIFSPAPEELPEEEVVLEALAVQDEEAEVDPKTQEESYDHFMTLDMELGGGDDDHRTPSGTGRDSSSGYNSLGRDSGVFGRLRYSGMFQDEYQSRGSDLDSSRPYDLNIRYSTEIIEATTETNIVESELPSSLADMNIDNVPLYEPPITGGFLVSFLVDARGGKMESTQTGIKMCLPPRSCQMPTRIMCRLLRLNKPALLPPLHEGEGLASRVLDIGPSGLKFLQPVEVELPHFASMRDGERELVVMRTEDGGWNWREVSVEDGQAVEGYGKNDEVFLPTKRFTKIVTKDLPERFAVVSRLKKETFFIGPAGENIKSTVLSQVQLSIPEGAVSRNTELSLQVNPVEESFNNLEEWVAVSPVVTLQPGDISFSKPIQITMPTPIYSGSSSSDLQTSLRLLCSVPKEVKGSGTNTAEWEDITDSTPLTVMNECASFTTRTSTRYWLIETRNHDNVTSDARLLYRKLTAVPYQAKFVVYAKMSADGTEAHLRVCCVTDDRVDKTLENQTGYVEVARSCDVEVNEGRPIHVRCLGNLTPANREPLQLNFYSFRENRLSVNVRILDSEQPPSCRLAFLKEPRKDRQGNILAICSLNVDLSEKNLKREQAKKLPDELLNLIGKEVGGDWISLGQQLDFKDDELQEIQDKRADEPFECAGDVLKSWRDKEGDEATMAALEKALRDMGREDIAKDFKRLAYSSYSKETVTVYQSPPSQGDLSPGPRPTRISEILDQTNDLNVTSDDDSTKSPSRDAPMFEAGLPVEADVDPSDQTGGKDNEASEAEKDKLIQEMFANDKGVLDFFGGQDGVDANNPTDETEI